MFSLLESKEEITIVQRKLEATIRRDFNIQAIKNIGYPGGTTYDAKVNTDRHHWFWSKDHKQTDEPNPRRFNWFGLFNEGSDLQISVEINTPFEARNYNVAGFFGRDNETGAIYLLHPVSSAAKRALTSREKGTRAAKRAPARPVIFMP
jgi:hypothetical protein